MVDKIDIDIVVTKQVKLDAKVNNVEVGGIDLGTATCQQLNDELTQPQRDGIHRMIPNKTGQTVSFATGDDGDLQKGRGVDFFILDCNNSFGNTNRFTDSVGGQNYDGTGGSLVDYVIDHLTNLAWMRTLNASVVWATSVANVNASNAVGFADWRMSNVLELCSILNHKPANDFLDYSPFNIDVSALAQSIWSSTTAAFATARAMTLLTGEFPGSIGALSGRLKTDTNFSLQVRNPF